MKVTSLLFVLLASAGWAHAQTIVPKLDQEGRKGDMARLAAKSASEKFNAADTDKDGKLSPEETAKAMPYVAENFAKRDKDKDGFLNWEEYVGHNRWKKDETGN
jgi:hypothetical protein